MTRPFPIHPSTPHERRVLFAVELVDPVTGEFVREDVRVHAEGLANNPLLNSSGRFVWLAEGDARPAAINVVPLGIPFEPTTEKAWKPPDDPHDRDETKRLLRITLQPNRTYPFPDGTTVLLGQLRESTTPDAAAVPGAIITLHCKINNKVDSKDNRDSQNSWISPYTATTNARGEFALILRFPSTIKPIDDGKITVWLSFRRDNSIRQTGNFELREGQVNPSASAFGWDSLRIR